MMVASLPSLDTSRPALPFARYALLVYIVLLADASLYPWSGWRDLGIGAFDYLSAPWPYYFTRFDIAVNIVGYLPLGFLLSLALYPSVRGVWGMILAWTLCGLLSAGFEALQTFLPSRVASKLDLLTNGIGALLGVLLAGCGIGPRLGRWQFRRACLIRAAPVEALLLVIWLAALLYPDPLAFAPGALFQGLIKDLLGHFGWNDAWELLPEHYVLGETILTTTSLLGTGCLLMAVVGPVAARAIVSGVLIVLAIATETLSAGLFYSPDNMWIWLTPGASWGLALAGCGLAGLIFAPGLWLTRISACALTSMLILVNLMPENPYLATGQPPWGNGQFLNFFGLTHWLNLTWPFWALGYLLWSQVKLRKVPA